MKDQRLLQRFWKFSFSVGLSLALVLPSQASPCIDYWGDVCSSKAPPKKETKEEKLLKLYEESLKWTPKNISPIERYAALHPTDPLAVKLLKLYLIDKQYRACLLSSQLTGRPESSCDYLLKQREQVLNGTDTISRAKSKVEREKTPVPKEGVTYYFFYSPLCPHCKKVLPYVKKYLPEAVMVPADQNHAFLYEKFKVSKVPTLIAVKGKKALKLSPVTPENLPLFLSYVNQNL